VGQRVYRDIPEIETGPHHVPCELVNFTIIGNTEISLSEVPLVDRVQNHRNVLVKPGLPRRPIAQHFGRQELEEQPESPTWIRFPLGGNLIQAVSGILQELLSFGFDNAIKCRHQPQIV